MRTPVSVLLHYKYSLQLQGKAKAYASSISNKIKCFSWDKWSSWGPGTWNYRWKSASILCKCNLAGSVLTADPAPLRPPPPCSRKRVWRGLCPTPCPCRAGCVSTLQPVFWRPEGRPHPKHIRVTSNLFPGLLLCPPGWASVRSSRTPMESPASGISPEHLRSWPSWNGAVLSRVTSETARLLDPNKGPSFKREPYGPDVVAVEQTPQTAWGGLLSWGWGGGQTRWCL